jgi:acetylglutamate kinase
MQKKIQIANTLIDAFPFIKRFSGKRVVIKYGGSAQSDEKLKEKFAQDIALLHLIGIKVIVVHGGGKKINSILDRLGIKSEFIDGVRVTSKENMEVVEMVLSGTINKEITSLLNKNGAKAIGISGKDASFLKAKPKDSEKFGLTGVVTDVDAKVLDRLMDDNFIPVIAPIATSEKSIGTGYNINADLAASAIASALRCEKIIFLTDTAGVLDKNGELISTIYFDQVKDLIENETITGGMIPKIEAALEALESGVRKAHIIDGRVEHSILLELFTSEGIGTVIKKEDR